MRVYTNLPLVTPTFYFGQRGLTAVLRIRSATVVQVALLPLGVTSVQNRSPGQQNDAEKVRTHRVPNLLYFSMVLRQLLHNDYLIDA